MIRFHKFEQYMIQLGNGIYVSMKNENSMM